MRESFFDETILERISCIQVKDKLSSGFPESKVSTVASSSVPIQSDDAYIGIFNEFLMGTRLKGSIVNDQGFRYRDRLSFYTFHCSAQGCPMIEAWYDR
tara:strand:+ start:170 stop:466 length:297 start_codon:yes stop_codon:yes gene_type:complete